MRILEIFGGIMEVGFTGTREGMTQAQRSAVQEILSTRTGIEKGHHGDCVGADADFHKLLVEQGIRVKGHPPIKDDFRAFCEFDEFERPKNYYARNRDIVNESDIMIVTPKEDSVQPKG